MNRYLPIIFLVLFSAATNGNGVSGKIQVVSPQTHPAWNGVMIQMADGKIVDVNCGNSTWALIRVQSELDKALVSVALSAKISQQDVRVYTEECAEPPTTATTIPVVSAIDLGLRY